MWPPLFLINVSWRGHSTTLEHRQGPMSYYQQSYGPPYSAGVDPAFNFGNSVYQPNYDVLASNPNPDTFLHDASQPVLDWTRFSNAPGAFQGQQYSGYAQPIDPNWQAFESGQDHLSLNQSACKEDAARLMQSECLPPESRAPLTPGTVHHLQHPPSQVNGNTCLSEPLPSNSSSSSDYYSLPADQQNAASVLRSAPSDRGSVASTQSSGPSVQRSMPDARYRSTHPYLASESSKTREEPRCLQNSTAEVPGRRDRKAKNPAFRKETLQLAREEFVAFCVSHAMLFPESRTDKKLYRDAATRALSFASSLVPGGPKPLTYSPVNWDHLKTALITFREGWLLLILLLVGDAYKLWDTAAFEEALDISAVGAGEWLALTLTLTEQEVLNLGTSLKTSHPGKSLPEKYRNLKIAAFKDDDAVQSEFRWWGHRHCKEAATKMLANCEGISPHFVYDVCVARKGLPFLAVVNMTIVRAIRHYPKFSACSGSETAHTWDFDLKNDEPFLKHVLTVMNAAVQLPQGRDHLVQTLDEIYAKLPTQASLYKAIQPGYTLNLCCSFVIDSAVEEASDTEGVGR